MQIDRYFAYGSNMNPARVAERKLNVLQIEAGTLPGFQLVFDKVSSHHQGEAHANIIFARDRSVEGVLYQLASPDEILKMDVFEATPVNYGREAVQVVCGDTRYWAWTYFANPAVRAAGCLPSQAYLAHLLAGRDYLSEPYYADLHDQAVMAPDSGIS